MQFELMEAKSTGISFRHSDGGSGNYFVIETMTAGLAIFDYDGDGLRDIYFCNGAGLPGTDLQSPLRNALYRNLGNWKFEDVSRQAGVDDAGYGLGVTAADYDNDGDVDLYLSNYGPNVFYVNNGDGTFAETTQWVGVGGGEKFGAGAVFLDIELDGDLDLYCANYQRFSFDENIVRTINGYRFHPGPADYPPEPDLLFRNLGDGRFEEISQSSGIASHSATGMGVIATDFDSDGDSDLFIANDSMPNFLFVNDGKGSFTEEALLYGVAYDRVGVANGNMGVDAGDYDRDGWIDLVTTTFQDEMPVLYRNMEGLQFDDTTNVAKLEPQLNPHVNWGVGFVDFDNDCDLDLFIACGHFMDNLRYIDDRTQLKVQNYLLANEEGNRFTTVKRNFGTGLEVVESSRGAAFDDLDGDGRVDVVVSNYNAPPNVLRNQTQNSRAYLGVRLIGRRGNRDAVGARVALRSGNERQVAERYAGRGYQSHYGEVLHFGLGNEPKIPLELEVKWPGAASQRFSVSEWNQVITLIEPVE
jgi:hypothetical protein